ncbi:MAG: glucose-6-phosphate isomerase [Candidatus Omnitrophota bacterium]
MEKGLIYDTGYMRGSVSEQDKNSIRPELERVHGSIESRNGEGKEFLDWMDIPFIYSESDLTDIEQIAAGMMKRSDAVIIVGIGGSYLGARTAIEALAEGPARKKIKFAGHNLSGDHLSGLLGGLKDKEISVNVISKSGSTAEPAIAFRIIEGFLEKKYGKKEAAERIVCTTDKHSGALRSIADRKGYKSLVIPSGIGGRFSVLSPVGLLPIACAGIDIRELLQGAKQQREDEAARDIWDKDSYKYAAIRNILYRQGKKIEIFSSFVYKLHYMSEWWKQLFGESEGKGGHGIFPASCDFSTDLHSLGQLIQDGERNIFETFIVSDKEKETLIPENKEDIDDLNYLAGKDMSFINRKAYEASSEAHFEGGVPNSAIIMPEVSAFNVGQLFYFFEKAVTVSAYISGVNPFDQPGVEAYKKKMFKLLGKPR